MEQTKKRTERAPCPNRKKCGGCQLSNLSYDEQLAFKQSRVRQLVGRYCPVRPIIGMDEPYCYRNKVQAAFGLDRSRRIISGVYQSSTHRIVPVDDCLLEDDIADRIIVTVRKMLPRYKLTAFDERTGKGFLRHVLVKRAFATGEVMVVLVSGTKFFPPQRAFTAELVKLHPEITTVIHNINDKFTSLVLGKQEKVLYGKGYIEDILCGCRFRISARSFYQINPVQTEILYNTAIEYAGLTGTERVLDAYCGIGTIGMVASRHAGEVAGVELNHDAVRDAIANARMNNIKNCWFTCADAGDFMEGLAAEGKKADVVFLDPPRAGSTEIFIASLAKMAPQRVVYISCNPVTLARDLGVFKQYGYRAELCQPVDMFPHTEHIETVVLLSHKKPDGHINVKVEFGEGEGKVPLDDIAERAENYKPKERVTYKMIKEYIEAKYGFKVHTAYIAEVKRELGLPMYDAPNAVEELKNPRKHPTPEKVEAIKDALKHFEVI